MKEKHCNKCDLLHEKLDGNFEMKIHEVSNYFLYLTNCCDTELHRQIFRLNLNIYLQCTNSLNTKKNDCNNGSFLEFIVSVSTTNSIVILTALFNQSALLSLV